jgi:hypothetical protein
MIGSVGRDVIPRIDAPELAHPSRFHKIGGLFAKCFLRIGSRGA